MPFRFSAVRGAALLMMGAVMILGAQANSPRAKPVVAYQPLAKAVNQELSGQRALATVAFVEQFYRLPGNRGFDASIDTVVRLLEQAGYVREGGAGSGQRLTYRVEERPLTQPAWSPLNATVTIVGESKPVLAWATNHNMLASNSYATPAGGVEAELVDVGAGTEADFAKVDVKGKIVMGDARIGQLATRAFGLGAVGAMATQKLPPYNQQAKNSTAITFSGNSITRDSTRRTWGIALSSTAATQLRAALAKGPVRLGVTIDAVFESRPERSLVAEIRGSAAPSERVVYSAHVQEPGANDNASGVGTLAEMARVAAKMLKAGTVNPGRTITFLWGNEIQWTGRYLSQDTVRRAGVKWGMSLDMVGENTAKTGGTFLIEKMKDPSAVWVRGEDQHTEWGGDPVPAEQIIPYWFNDFVRQRCLAQAGNGPWVVKANPYEGGSDHTPFLQAKIPAVLFWHFTDQHYHTDLDRIDMVSPTTMQNVGSCAMTTGFILAAGTPAYTKAALTELTEVAEHELTVQGALSRGALGAADGDVAKETLILSTWRDYYLGAITKIVDLNIGPIDLSREIAASQARVRTVAEKELATLKKG